MTGSVGNVAAGAMVTLAMYPCAGRMQFDDA